MSKAVLISIHPEWCEKIARGEKTIEVRKTRPNLDTPFKCYIYCTKGNLSYPVKNGMVCHNNGGMSVIGEFVCSRIESFTTDYRMNREQTERISRQSCVGMIELAEYEGASPCLYGWHISDLVIYDKPKSLREFTCGGNTLTRPPMSWWYVEEVDT